MFLFIKDFGCMLKIYFDCETTGLNPYADEIITAYFEVHKNGIVVDSYNFKSQTNNWSDEAQEIHKITYEQMRSHPPKKEAFRNLLGWMPNNFSFVTFVNKNTMFGTLNFDVVILENELNLLGCERDFLTRKHNAKNHVTIHTLARECAKQNLFQPIMSDKNRPSFSQENVYMALFGEKYNSHNAKEDVKALVRIHKRLIQLQDENITLFDFM
jgi:DNA polymerase III alpha subunit (gram-positive type)